jgi:hypothetical protein
MTFGVTADAGSEVKYFQCPRYVCNRLDIAGSFVRINYRNANGEIDSHLIEDLTVDGDNVLFSWELSPKVTAYKGQIRFVMCVTGPDTKVAWHTTLGTGIVLEGLEPDYTVIQAGTSDVLAQLLALVERQTKAVEDVGAEWVRNVQTEGTDQITAVQAAGKNAEASAVAEIEAKGKNVKESIPDDYTALGNAVDGLIRGRAGAIVCEVEGSAIAVKDASDMAMQGLRIFGRSTQDGTPTPDAPVEIKSIENSVLRVCGKNILPYPYDETSASQNGMSLVPQDDGGIAASGTPTGYVDIYLYDGPPLAKRGNVTISIHGVFENVTASLGFHDAAGATIGSVNAIPEGRNYITVNLDDYPTATRWVVLIKRVNNNQPVSGVIYPQIELGETHTEYKPYTGQAIETTHPLRGIPVTTGGNYTDENGQQWICDEVDLERGVLVKRVNMFVIDGSFTGSISRETEKEKTQVFLVVLPKPHPEVYRRDFFSNRFVSYVATDDAEKMVPNINSVYVALNKERLSELSIIGFRAWLASNHITMHYVQETPEEIPLSETEIAAYRALHTNKPNTTILNDSGAHMKVEYAADTKLYIDNKLAALVGNI